MLKKGDQQKKFQKRWFKKCHLKKVPILRAQILMLTIADEGGRGGLKTPKIGWHNMWAAPKWYKCNMSDTKRQTRLEVPGVLATSPCVEHLVKAFIPFIVWCVLIQHSYKEAKINFIFCLARSVRWFVKGAVWALFQCQDWLVILLESQEVNPEAVWHRVLLRVVLKLAGSMKENLTQTRLKFFLLNFSIPVHFPSLNWSP